jgi:hypothetical protein
MLIDLLADLRYRLQSMVNQFLSLVKAMDVNFISVRPKTGKKENDPSKQH